MSIPAGAPVFTQVMDPSDTLDFYVVVSKGQDASCILTEDEQIESYQLALSAEAVAAGLRLLTGTREPVRDGLNISFWLDVSPAARSLSIFNGSGLLIGIELTVETDAALSRTKQRTFGLRMANQ